MAFFSLCRVALSPSLVITLEKISVLESSGVAVVAIALADIVVLDPGWISAAVEGLVIGFWFKCLESLLLQLFSQWSTLSDGSKSLTEGPHVTIFIWFSLPIVLRPGVLTALMEEKALSHSAVNGESANKKSSGWVCLIPIRFDNRTFSRFHSVGISSRSSVFCNVNRAGWPLWFHVWPNNLEMKATA